MHHKEDSYDRTPSEERLNAYVDNELDREERIRLQRQVCTDPETARAVCELRTVKELVQTAYQDLEPAPAATRTPAAGLARRHLPRGLAAAAAALVVGAVAGWTAHEVVVTREMSALRAVALASPSQTQRIILHVSSADPRRFEQALADTERLLERSRAEGRVVQVEIVANTEGLNLLRTGQAAAYVERLRSLTRRYKNVRVLACSRTIEKFRLMGVDVHLIPEAQVIPGALERIVDRLQAGWVYIKV